MRLREAILFWAVIWGLGGGPARHPASAATPMAGPPGVPDLTYYLADSTTYEPSVPDPETFFGFPVGSRHLRHHEIVAYLETLASTSGRVRIESIGSTHEGRPLVEVIISSPENLSRIDEIRASRSRILEGREPDGPLVVWLVYSIHGDEASGANAAPLLAYHLAAGSDGFVRALLQDLVVIIDPAQNPDGLDRYASWLAAHRSETAVADPRNREHDPYWPGARTNHYWFDLNRDWLPLVHPESRARAAWFQGWRPDLVVDLHEMGRERTHFFQPGVAGRTYPLTPGRTRELTSELSAWPAAAHDAAGGLYYTEEDFDDYYYGKGSTYPDIQGSIGILVEQASSEGRVVETSQGPLAFPYTVKNQVRSSMSFLRGALEKREALREHGPGFYRDARRSAEADPVRGFVVGEGGDPVRLLQLAELLLHHGIEVRTLGETLEVDGRRFEEGGALFVSNRQPQYLLVQALFERRTELPDSIFYDISAWTLPDAYGLPFASLRREPRVGPPWTEPPRIAGRIPSRQAALAYAFAWERATAPRALQRLLSAGARVKLATRPFVAATDEGTRRFEPGSIVIPVVDQEDGGNLVWSLLPRIAEDDRIEVFAVNSGLTAEGIDLGSPHLVPLRAPKPLLVIGPGIRGSEAGEVWHLLDRDAGVPLTMVDAPHAFRRTRLSDYTHLILVDGSYERWEDTDADRIRRFVAGGGTLVAWGRAAAWIWDKNVLTGYLAEDGLPPPVPAPARAPLLPDSVEVARIAYALHEEYRDARQTKGAILLGEVDLSHPLAFGIGGAEIALFRSGDTVLRRSENPFETVVRFSDEPLLAGFVHPERLGEVAGTPSVVATRVGGGLVVRVSDDPLFRGYWRGTERLFLNALFLGSTVAATPLQE